MVSLPYKLELANNKIYTTLLLQPKGEYAFFGRNDGCVEVWKLNSKKKIVELRYLQINEFGEEIPLEEPVVALSAPNNFKYVYAFMGSAAYCIDVDLLTIIQQIPIAEQVVSGNVSPIKGEIGVITEPGYLSRWSPKFIERVGSIEFAFDTPICYLCHDYIEERVILVFEQGKILLANLDDEPYTIEYTYPEASDLLGTIWFDKNSQFQVLIEYDGSIRVEDVNSDIKEISNSNILSNGISSAKNKLRDFINDQDTSETKRNYIRDYRLDRQSKDRYVAARESLGRHQKVETSPEEDSNTLYYAMKEYRDGNIQQKSEAKSVMQDICRRNNIEFDYVRLAFKFGVLEKQLIEQARYYEFETFHRRNRIKQIMIFSLILAFLTLIISVVFGANVITFAIVVPSWFLIFPSIYYWSRINTKPILPFINNFKAMRVFVVAVVITSMIIYFYDLFNSEINSFLDKIPI